MEDETPAERWRFQWVMFKYERLSTFCFYYRLIGHFERFCRKGYEEGIEPKEYPHGDWFRAGVRRAPKLVEAKWLLADLPIIPVCVPSTAAKPVIDPIGMENLAPLQGELKRRREDDTEMGTTSSGDVRMTEVS